jgi:hypothetical protein
MTPYPWPVRAADILLEDQANAAYLRLFCDPGKLALTLS